MVDLSALSEEKRKHYEMKVGLLHNGLCSSPGLNSCPCKNVCPMHGRCCDCIRYHIGNRRRVGGPAKDTNWLMACAKLAQEGAFEQLETT